MPAHRPYSPDREVHTLALAGLLRAGREAAEWNQSQLAHRAGVSQTTMSRLEAGTVSPDVYTLGRLAKALGTDTPGMLAAVDEVEADMLRAAQALTRQPYATWANLLPVLGECAAALALAAARLRKGAP